MADQERPEPQREQPRGDSRKVTVGAEFTRPTLGEIPAKPKGDNDQEAKGR